MFVFLFFTLLFSPVLSYFVVVTCCLCHWPLAVEFGTLINKELNWIIIIISVIIIIKGPYLLFFVCVFCLFFFTRAHFVIGFGLLSLRVNK
jgi:hypothetical protein